MTSRLIHLRTASCTIMDEAFLQIVRLAPSLDSIMSSGRRPLESTYRETIDQRHLRVNARTKIKTSVAWA